MRSLAIIGALAVLAAPLSAQNVRLRSGGELFPTSGSNRQPATVIGQIPRQEQQQGQDARRKSDRVPPGQMPPAGMCRIWIDDVPPGRQPAPTDCQTAVATKPANARVIFGGEGSSFPGKGNGKFDKKDKDKDNKVKNRDRDDDDDDEIRDRARRGGVLGSVIPSTTAQKPIAKKNGKGKGRG